MKRTVLLTTLPILLGGPSAAHSLSLPAFGGTVGTLSPQLPIDLIPDNFPSCGSLEVKSTRREDRVRQMLGHPADSCHSGNDVLGGGSMRR